MLRGVRQRHSGFLRERLHRAVTLSQQLEELNSDRTRQRFAQLGEMTVEAVFEASVCSIGNIQVINRLLEYSGPLSNPFSWAPHHNQGLRRNATNSHAKVRLVSATDRPSARAAACREDGACRNVRNDRPTRRKRTFMNVMTTRTAARSRG